MAENCKEVYARTIKPSGNFYRDIIAANGYRRDMLEKYIKNAPKGY